MVINLVFVAGTVVLGLIGDSTAPASRPHGVSPTAVRVAARPDNFSPAPRARKPRPAPARPPSAAQPEPSDEDEVDEDRPAARRPAPAAVRRRPAVEEMESEPVAEEDEDEEEKPRVKRKSRKREEEEEEEEEEDDAPMASLPVILPRVVSFQAGVSAMGRSFAYNTALQQKESTFPRPGIALTVEAYPLLRMPRGWYRKLGVGFTLAMEFGAAALANATTGASTSFPVTQRRWALDVRYVIPAGERVVLVPSLGYGSNVFDLKTRMPGETPTNCNNMSMLPCIADIQASYVVAGAHIRIAATERLAFSLSGGYLLGLSVGKGAGQIGVESTETKISGFQVEPGVNFMLTDWLAFRATVPFTSYSYAFTSAMATYKSATETYYGVTGGAVIFMR